MRLPTREEDRGPSRGRPSSRPADGSLQHPHHPIAALPGAALHRGMLKYMRFLDQEESRPFPGPPFIEAPPPCLARARTGRSRPFPGPPFIEATASAPPTAPSYDRGPSRGRPSSRPVKQVAAAAGDDDRGPSRGRGLPSSGAEVRRFGYWKSRNRGLRAVVFLPVPGTDTEEGASGDEGLPLRGGCNCGAVRFEVTGPLVVARSVRRRPKPPRSPDEGPRPLRAKRLRGWRRSDRWSSASPPRPARRLRRTSVSAIVADSSSPEAWRPVTHPVFKTGRAEQPFAWVHFGFA